MTICIGALCANAGGHASRAAIVASDRMVTLGGITEFEHEVPKIFQVTDRIVALMAGDALRGSRVVREIAPQIPAGATPVQGVAEGISVHYAESRLSQIDSDLFRPRGINIRQFYTQGLQQQMAPQLVLGMDNHVSSFNYGVDLLIAGVDDAGAHLYFVGNPGGAFSDFQQIGFHAIGSGALHALQSMIGFGHMGARGLNETLFTVYASKRRAEVAPGVGHDTDLAIVKEDGIMRVPQTTLDELEELYQEYQRPVSQELKDRMAAMRLTEEENHDAG